MTQCDSKNQAHSGDRPLKNEKYGLDHTTAFFTYRAILKVADAFIVLGTWNLCWYLRFIKRVAPITKGVPDFQIYLDAAPTLILCFIAVFHMVGVYRQDRIHFGFKAIRKITQGTVLGVLSFVSISYFLGNVNYSRIFLIIFSLSSLGTTLFGRALLQGVWALFQSSKAVKKIRVLLVGSGELMTLYYRQISIKRPYPVNWVGRLGEGADFLPEVPHLGAETDLIKTIRSEKIDLVVVSYSAERTYVDTLKRLTNELVAVKVIPDFGQYNTFSYAAGDECGIPLLHFNQTPMGATDRVFKRWGDIIFSSLFLIIFSPLYALIALLVKTTSRGPIIYSQVRVGADGTVFECYKFRSMKMDAESSTGPVWAQKQDDRTTWLGGWLRKTSLDELPQMVNVLIGNMSLIGPRPERPVFVEEFRSQIPHYMLRHKMKSGLTGWAQVNHLRGNTSLERRIKYDLYYIGHWSHWFDLKILTLTPWTLIKGFFRGYAY